MGDNIGIFGFTRNEKEMISETYNMTRDELGRDIMAKMFH
ncbi:hypothetical protein D593_1762 [Streptococcus intermedius BA1]|nr:hypothetical protein D593_1762 [Streptococcus intermedius BA1]